MYRNKKVAAVVTAAGSGSRMGGSVPKQFLPVGERSMLSAAAGAMARSESVDALYVVVPAKELDRSRRLLARELSEDEYAKIGAVVTGGASRQQSVYRGLRVLKELDPDVAIVLIHDGARPFVSRQVIDNVLAGVDKYQAAIPVIGVTDTIRRNGVTLDRGSLSAVQTPQGFELETILRAHRQAAEQGFAGTDDASLVEEMGLAVTEVAGDPENRKVTVPSDLPQAMPARPEEDGESGGLRAGTGYDVHRFGANRALVLGGVKIPYEKGLIGHSDADVLTHAVMDALLGAAGMGDIGIHFPDSDPDTEGVCSLDLLEAVGEMLRNKGYAICNIDGTLVCERPKIAAYTPEMIRKMARALRIPPERINLKGTTTEGLGATGRREGIAAQAVCLIRK